MSLQIWMPLTKDLSNIGVCDATITNNGATLDSSGKLGGSYYFNGSSDIRISMPPNMTSIRNTSVCAWIKSTGSVVALGGISNDGNYTKAMVTLFTSGWQFGGSSGYKYISGGSIANSGVWHHVACVVTDTNVTTYLDGTQVATKTFSEIGVASFDITSANFIEIGCDHPGSDERLTGYVNDFRVYDHAISVAEIKALSMGLVCHYKLDDFESTDNLIVNGFGELGTENWTSSSISTTEIPPNHSEIKASFYNANMTVSYIPISKNHVYTISGYIKAMSGRTSNVYPSIYPYDYDKNMIQYFHSRIGFDTATATTLSQPLRNGDTVIHATNLSNWRVDTTTYYFHVAIFGYKNSAGYVYDDLIYTQDCPKFGSRTDKSNIDKTNNTITLLAAYTGADRPAGTTICQATEGSTYFYPWSGINPTSIPDWTFKTGNFSTKDTRLLACEYIRWSTYGGCYIAGNKLVDNFLYTDQTIDSSGHGYHGTRYGNLTTSYKSARHDICTVFDGSTTYIDIVSEMFPVVLNGPFTISMWIYNTDTGDRSILFGNYGLTGSFFNIEKTINETVRFYWNASPDKTFSNSVLTSNAFTHLVITRDGNTVKSYINGILKDTSTTTLTGTIPTTANNFRIGADSRTGATRFKGCISDFRIYSTTLNAEDVLALYNVSASVANDGAFIGYQMKEG